MATLAVLRAPRLGRENYQKPRGATPAFARTGEPRSRSTSLITTSAGSREGDGGGEKPVLGRSVPGPWQQSIRGRTAGSFQNPEDCAHRGLQDNSEYESEHVPSKLDVASSSLVSRCQASPEEKPLGCSGEGLTPSPAGHACLHGDLSAFPGIAAGHRWNERDLIGA